MACVFLAAGVSALPLAGHTRFKISAYSALGFPLSVSQSLAQAAGDLVHFRRNAKELQALRAAVGKWREEKVELEELRRENGRLGRLLDLERAIPFPVRRLVAARVVARSPSFFSRTLLLDKGTEDGVRVNQLVLAESSLAGKIIESGRRVSKVLLVRDPNFRIGVMLQESRQHGILTGTPSGQIRVKFIPVDARIPSQELVLTAGFGGLFPKGILVGRIVRTWKEPGQIYQAAEVKPYADFERLEEAVILEP